MANPEHVEIARQGREAIARWRRDNPGGRLDLSWADLSKTDLSQANLSGAKLGGAKLGGANLSWADLSKTDLSQAILYHTNLGNIDLSPTKNLDKAIHRGPSTIAVDTLIRSFKGGGNTLASPLGVFFQGAGVPKELLDALPRILEEAVHYTCFISYGESDLGLSQKLYRDLKARGVNCWLYARDKTIGQRTWSEIDKKMDEADRVILLCSARSLIRQGTLKELENQIDRDPNKLIPISCDDLWKDPGFQIVRAGRDLGPWLRERNYASFENEEKYADSLEELLKALRRPASRVPQGEGEHEHA